MPQQDDPFAAIGTATEPCEIPARSLEQAKKEENTLEDSHEKVRKEVHSLSILALRFGAMLIGVVVLVRVWHLAGPHDVGGYSVRWLTDEEIQSIDKMLFSSAFGGLVLGYLKEIMHPIKKD